MDIPVADEAVARVGRSDLGHIEIVIDEEPSSAFVPQLPTSSRVAE